MKTCTKCKIEKPLNDFTKRKDSKDGLEYYCKSCRSAMKHEYYTKNKEEINTEAKIRYKNNSDEIKLRVRIYRENNKEKIKEYLETVKCKKSKYMKLYRKKNKQQISKQRKIYNSSEIGRISNIVACSLRRALKKSTSDGSVSTSSLNKLLRIQNGECFYCKCRLDFNTDRGVHLDHYIPLSKGGVHSIDNVVWSCAKCNLTKSDKMPKQ